MNDTIMNNSALVLEDVKKLKFENREIPTPGVNEVLVKTACVGICGSDVHYWQEGRIGDFILTSPMVMGHETSGVIQGVGRNLINDLKIGDRVAIEPGIPCRNCKFCKEGIYNLCPHIKFHATPPIDGTLRDYFVHPSDFCYKLPDNVTLEEGALVEPLAVASYAFKRGRFFYGANVFISGAGAIGLSCVACALTLGASNIYITDCLESRLAIAKSMGAHQVIKVDRNDPNVLKTLSGKFQNPGPPDICFEATGSDMGIELALGVTKPGGTMVSIGFSLDYARVKLFNVIVKQIDIVGIFRYANVYAQTVDMVASKKVDVSKMVTHRFAFKDAIEAYEQARTTNESLKVIINVHNEDPRNALTNGAGKWEGINVSSFLT